MQIDRARVAAAVFAAAVAAASAAVAWTWHAKQAVANRSAALALAVVDERLDVLALDLTRLAGLPDVAMSPAICSEPVVQALLQESLNSPLARRFEVLSRGHLVRCGPQGQRSAEPMDVPRRPGVSLVLGTERAPAPEVMLSLANGQAFTARLDAQALRLPEALWPTGLHAQSCGVVVRSDEGGALTLWGAPSKGADDAPLIQAQAHSGRHHVTVAAEVSAFALAAEAAKNSLWAAMLAVGLSLTGVAWTWRRAVLQSRLVHRLAHALRKRQFEPFVQPIVDLQTGRCIGGEVLMRWKHPQRGVLGPGEFIDEAERTGLIIGMSDLTMSLAAHRLAPLAQAEPDLYFSFNITPGQLREPGFAARLAEIFTADTVPRHQVLLELTERDFVDPRAKGMLIALRADGWRIAIDDFGTGQSSLSTIEALPIDRIKIDRAFVSTIDDKTVSRPVLDAIINLARELQIPLIAEGVETRSQWTYLASRDVASAQGYLMAKPMAITDYLHWWSEQAHTAATPLELPPKDDPQRALWRRLAAVDGLKIEDRTYKLRVYPRCFVGHEAVDWMVATIGISRAEAVRRGRALVAVGLIHHVLDEHDFNDGDFFYRLTPDTAGAAPETLPDAVAGMKSFQQSLAFPWRSHSRGLLRHHQCTTGHALVDWIMQTHGMARPVAVQWATQWMRQGALRHVFDARPFSDDRTLYRLG